MRATLPLVLIVTLAAISAALAGQEKSAAQDKTVALLQQLTDTPGPPGFEEPIRKVLVDLMKPLSSSLAFDGLGSIIAAQGSTGPRVMIDAHMDELGGMIRRVTPRGLLTMQMLGGWLDQALVDQRWIVIGSKGPVRAVTGIRDAHVVPPDERTRVYTRDTLLLDVGAASDADVAAMGISPGDPVVPDSPFTVLNGTQNYLAKAWDDRVGCGVVIEAMRRLAAVPHANTLLWTITTQEEVGLRGAEAAAAVVKPDVAIAIEGGITGDVYPGRPEETQARLGAGPGMFLFDSSALPNRRLTQLLKQTASEKQIPLQADLVQGYGDDSAEIQRSNGGVPTVNLVVPIRYTHSHNGVMNRRDFDQMVALLVAVLQKLDAAAVARLRDFTP
jgi:putative aminopeptidase FrvX